MSSFGLGFGEVSTDNCPQEVTRSKRTSSSRSQRISTGDLLQYSDHTQNLSHAQQTRHPDKEAPEKSTYKALEVGGE